MLYLLENLSPLLKYTSTHWFHMCSHTRTKEEIVQILNTEYKPAHELRLTPIVKVLSASVIPKFWELLGVPINAKVRDFVLREGDRIIVPGSNVLNIELQSSEGWTDITVISINLLGEDGMITEKDIKLLVKEAGISIKED